MNHLIQSPLIPYASNLASSMLVGTQSKAFARSMKTEMTKSSELTDFVILPIKVIIAC